MLFLLPFTKHSILNPTILRAAIERSRSKQKIGFRILCAMDVDSSFMQELHKSYPMILPEETPYFVDFTKPKEIASSMEGCTGVILSTGWDDPLLSGSEMNLLEAIQSTSIPHVVKVSCPKGELSSVNIGKAHGEIEQRAQEILSSISGSSLTILRPYTLMQRFLYGRYHQMLCGRTLCVSVKHGRIAFVDAMDVAHVLVHTLLNPHTVDLTLTGPTALSFPEVAKIFSQTMEQPVTYSYMPLWAVQPSMWIRGERPDAIATEIEMARALEHGVEATVTSTIQEVLSRPPRSLQAFVQDHHEAWPYQGFH